MASKVCISVESSASVAYASADDEVAIIAEDMSKGVEQQYAQPSRHLRPLYPVRLAAPGSRHRQSFLRGVGIDQFSTEEKAWQANGRGLLAAEKEWCEVYSRLTIGQRYSLGRTARRLRVPYTLNRACS